METTVHETFVVSIFMELTIHWGWEGRKREVERHVKQYGWKEI